MFQNHINNIKIDPTFHALARSYRKRVIHGNRDVVLAITGKRGVGKTLLSMVISYLCQKQLSWDNFVFVPTEDNVKNQLNITKKGQVALIDEAVQLLYKMDFASSIVKELYKRFQRERKFNRIVIMNIQQFTDLPLGFRKDIVNSWIHITKTGHAVVLRSIDVVGNEDPWLLNIVKKDLSKLSNLKRLANTFEQVQYLKRLPIYAGEINFPKDHYNELFVKSGIEEDYEKRAKAASVEFEQANQEQEDWDSMTVQKRALIQLSCHLKDQMGFNGVQIAKMAGLSPRSVTRYIKLGIKLLKKDQGLKTNNNNSITKNHIFPTIPIQ